MDTKAFLSEVNLISNGRLARDHRLESVVIGEGRPRGGWLIVERPCTTAEEWFVRYGKSIGEHPGRQPQTAKSAASGVLAISAVDNPF